MYPDLRWVGISPNSANFNAAQALGTGAEPTVDWDTKGVFLPAGTVISSFKLAGNVNSTEIVDLDLRLFFQHGPAAAAWDSSATTTRNMLLSMDGAGFVINPGMNFAQYTLSYTTPEDGYFSIAVKPDATSVLTATRYLYMTNLLDVTLPPSV